jgi:1-acyl-sn-glycerol-3-phosphate acyltransferase
VVLFPEGTRSRDGRLLPFKKGSVHLALDAGVPLVPMAIWGTFAAMPRGSLLVRRGHVRLVIGEPIETVDLTAEDRHRLNDRVRERVAVMVDELSVHDANQGQAMGGRGHSGPGPIA